MSDRTIYFSLMCGPDRLVNVGVRPIAAVGEGHRSPTHGYEVRYADKSPERGMITVPPHTDELYLMLRVLQDYFAAHPHDIVSA